ncbi:MAG: S53 family peptidase [Sciscionella sp.]|nr:S53 family peptidase [Sciscionella sp.]
MRKIPRIAALAAGFACAAAGALAIAGPASATGTSSASPATPVYAKVCANTTGPRCLAIVNRTASQHSELAMAKGANATPDGLGPTDIQSAYNLSGGASGGTVALIEAGNYPSIEQDLQTYRNQYGLSQCTKANGCLKVVNMNGQTSPLPSNDNDWAVETALDMDAVSSACPACHILVVEAPSENDVQSMLTFDRNMATANASAAKLGAKASSNSWGDKPSLEKYATDSAVQAGYNQPSMVTAVSSGDDGKDGGITVPSSFTSVVAVGGTTLKKDSSARGWTETAWNGAGSGCSKKIKAPSWQSSIKACNGKRALTDVSAVADPATGLAIYGPDPYGGSGSQWQVVGGTSLSSPLVAAIYTRAGNTGSGSAVHNASSLYSHTADLNDVTSGNNGSCGAPVCTAGKGWDGPTGLGTPNGLGAF